jgi:hypothetical protein
MNNRRIGFDRELKLDWLDLTAGLVQEGFDIRQTRQELTARLASEIPGQEACRKTVTVLTRLWSRVPLEHQALQSEALDLLPRIVPEERLWLHWGMSLIAYPFFRDVASTAGRLLKLQGEFESTQVLRRMQEAWGQRTTLERAVQRLLQTFVAWGVTRELPSARHVYQAAPPRQTTNLTLALWLMECVLRSALEGRSALERRSALEGRSALGGRSAFGGPGVHKVTPQDNGQLPLVELVQSLAAFPFELAAHAAALRRSDRFEISHQGLDLEMVAPRAG